MTTTTTKQRQQDAIWAYSQNANPDRFFPGNEVRHRFLVKRIPAGSTVLNVGVGMGNFERMALQKGVEIHALDPSAESISRIAAELGLGERARQGYFQRIPFPDATFDTVVASEVLEHLPEEAIRESLREAKRVLRPGGRLLGTVPAEENLAASRTICPQCRHEFHVRGHEQSFTAERLQAVLSSTFPRVRLRRCILPCSKNAGSRIAAHVRAFARKLGLGTVKGNWLFECR